MPETIAWHAVSSTSGVCTPPLLHLEPRDFLGPIVKCVSAAPSDVAACLDKSLAGYCGRQVMCSVDQAPLMSGQQSGSFSKAPSILDPPALFQ